MQKVAVVADSVACLTKHLTDQSRITIAPVTLLVQGKIYRDSLDISPSSAYKLFLHEPESFATSPASPGNYLEAFREAKKVANDIVCVTLSSRLSTEHNTAMVARELAGNEFPGSSIMVVDSQSVGPAEGFVALAAARAAAEGKELSAVVETAEKVKDKVEFVAFLETVRYVYRTGRVPKIAAEIGSWLDAKPILRVRSGVVHFKGIVRNREQGEDRLLGAMREKVGDRPVHVAVSHAYAPQEAMKLEQRVRSQFNCVEIWTTEFSPVMGYATGTGTLGLAFYPEE